MTKFSKGDVVLFYFPYTDLTNRKLRPCLVLSSEMEKDIILCQITSKQVSRDEFTVELKKDETDEGTLQIDSFIRCNMLFTAETSQIKRKVCKLSKEKYSKVVDKILEIVK